MDIINWMADIWTQVMGNGVAEVAWHVFGLFFLIFIVIPVSGLMFTIWLLKRLWEAL